MQKDGYGFIDENGNISESKIVEFNTSDATAAGLKISLGISCVYSKVSSDNGDAFGVLGMTLMALVLLSVGLLAMREEKSLNTKEI